MTTVSCNHGDFAAEVDVNRLEDVAAFSADVRIRCTWCGEGFTFVGVEPGLSSHGPRVSISGLELHVPIVPESARLGPAARWGFEVKPVQTNAVAGESQPRRDVTEPRRGVS